MAPRRAGYRSHQIGAGDKFRGSRSLRMPLKPRLRLLLFSRFFASPPQWWPGLGVPTLRAPAAYLVQTLSAHSSLIAADCDQDGEALTAARAVSEHARQSGPHCGEGRSPTRGRPGYRHPRAFRAPARPERRRGAGYMSRASKRRCSPAGVPRQVEGERHRRLPGSGSRAAGIRPQQTLQPRSRWAGMFRAPAPRPKLNGRWSQPGSNRRPLACHASALPAELWPR